MRVDHALAVSAVIVATAAEANHNREQADDEEESRSDIGSFSIHCDPHANSVINPHPNQRSICPRVVRARSKAMPAIPSES